jgi:hypothetical protein
MDFNNIWFRIVHWETWDWRIKYFLISPAWFWFCLRARSFWFFTASNPTLTFGGFDGESKKEMYAQLPPGTYPKSVFVPVSLTFDEAEKMFHENSFMFPVAVKPDVAKMGLMFRRINNRGEFRSYHEKSISDYILQELVEYPLEVSVFYYRYPGSKKGSITGFLKKEYLTVIGDGKSPLLELMQRNDRARLRVKEMKGKHRDKLGRILPEGESYVLSYALNLSRGGRLVSLEHEKDDRLLKIFDDLSLYSGHFYYGRYDIKCRSIEDLKAGKHFSILEYNGSGAEPHHVYGNGYTLMEACKILVQHWQILFEISKANNKKGIPYWGFMKGWTFLNNASDRLKKLRILDSQTAVDTPAYQAGLNDNRRGPVEKPAQRETKYSRGS